VVTWSTKWDFEHLICTHIIVWTRVAIHTVFHTLYKIRRPRRGGLTQLCTLLEHAHTRTHSSDTHTYTCRSSCDTHASSHTHPSESTQSASRHISRHGDGNGRHGYDPSFNNSACRCGLQLLRARRRCRLCVERRTFGTQPTSPAFLPTITTYTHTPPLCCVSRLTCTLRTHKVLVYPASTMIYEHAAPRQSCAQQAVRERT
jgi:hypothetical protein